MPSCRHALVLLHFSISAERNTVFVDFADIQVGEFKSVIYQASALPIYTVFNLHFLIKLVTGKLCQRL